MTLYRLDDVTPRISPRAAFIAPNASVTGRIIIEAGASIWFGAVLRGDNEPITIGANANVQDHCVLHTDPGFPLTVGRGCTIGHRVILHGCVIGENSLVGMGAIILNGAVIGKNCLIGAGALITEGAVVPDNSLMVGMPARRIRDLDARTTDELAQSAEHYVRNGRRFAAGLAALSDTVA